MRGIRSAVAWLAIINVAAFIIQNFSQAFTENLILVQGDVFTRPWILVTYMFLHANLMHLFLNMYALMIFGSLLESRIGWKNFLTLYFSSGIVAGLGASFFYLASLGASGAVMGVLAALVVLMPNLKVLFFFIIPMPFWVAGVAWTLMDVFGILYPSGIGNIAHLIGSAVGVLFILNLKKQHKSYHVRFKSKTHMSKRDIDEYLRKGRI